jgi:hypothetical protein
MEDDETPKVLDKILQNKMVFDIKKKFKIQVDGLKA